MKTILVGEQDVSAAENEWKKIFLAFIQIDKKNNIGYKILKSIWSHDKYLMNAELCMLIFMKY